MQKGKTKQVTRNPVQRSFGAGINQSRVIPNKKRKDRRTRRRGLDRSFDHND